MSENKPQVCFKHQHLLLRALVLLIMKPAAFLLL